MTRSRVFRLTLVLTLTMWVLIADKAVGQTYRDLHDFNCATEGCGPDYTSLLAQGRDGNLYGTASFGGLYGDGTIFRIAANGSVTTLHNFDGTDGMYPYGGLILGADGNFYGTTFYGGANNLGTLFRVTPSGVLTVLHAFGGGVSDGTLPMSTPTLANDGNYYGVAEVGDNTHDGMMYKYSPSSGYTIVATLGNNIPGSGLFAPLIQGIDGNFYSTSYDGGVNGSGTVYSLSPTGAVNVIYNFDTLHGGWGYAPVVQDSQGNLFGTEAQGGTDDGGVIFGTTTSGNFKSLYNFINYCPGQAYGCVPAGGLVFGNDSNLYGSTYRGGPNNDGVFFKITRAGAYTQLATLNGANGAGLVGTPIQHTSGTIYGLASTGGAYGGGVLYSLNVGLKPFVSLLFSSGKAGTLVGILGQGFSTAHSVSFNGVASSFKVISKGYLVAKIPSGATSGFVVVQTSTKTFKSNRQFVIQ